MKHFRVPLAAALVGCGPVSIYDPNQTWPWVLGVVAATMLVFALIRSGLRLGTRERWRLVQPNLKRCPRCGATSEWHGNCDCSPDFPERQSESAHLERLVPLTLAGRRLPVSRWRRATDEEAAGRLSEAREDQAGGELSL